MQQNRFGVLENSERVSNFAEREGLFRIYLEIRGRNKLLVRVRIALDRFFAQLDQAALGERTQRLVVERSFAQQLRGEHGLLQFGDGVEELGLPRRAFPQVFDLIRHSGFGVVDLCQRLHEKLFFPTDLRAPDHLRQQAAHDGVERAAVVDAHPFRQFQKRLADYWSFADERLDWSNSLRVALLQHGQDRGEGGFVAKRNSHARADTDAVGQRLRHGIIELALNGAVDNHANV